MQKMKLLLALFMGTLLVFTAQRTYYVKTDTLSDIYSDIIFTRLAVESQQYTRQIEYGLKNGKSLDNFYNIQTILSGVKRCYSYINGAYIISDDFRVMYSNSEDGLMPPTAISINNFEGDRIYSVHTASDSYVLTMPIRGKGEQLCGYLTLTVQSSAIRNTLSDICDEYEFQAMVLSVLSFMMGIIFMIHFCRDKNRVFRRGFGIISGTVCSYIAADGFISIYKLLITIEGIIQQSISKITLSLQNDLDTVQQKGVSIGKIVDFNSWLFESGENIPFIENLIYDKNYKITASVSENYIWQQIWRYAAVILMVLLIFGAAFLAVYFVISVIEKMYVNRKRITDERRN